MHRTIRLMLRIAVIIMIILVFITTSVFTLYRLFPLKYINQIEKYCKIYDVNIYLVLSVIKAESNFNPRAVSHAGACGLMQITKETFDFCIKESGIVAETDEIFDTEKNIGAGVWYISYLLNHYHFSVIPTVAAYNAGLYNVDKWLLDESCSPDGRKLVNIPYGETERHVKKIKTYIRFYKILYPDIEQ